MEQKNKCIIKNMGIMSIVFFTIGFVFLIIVKVVEHFIGDYTLIPLFLILIYLIYYIAKENCK